MTTDLAATLSQNLFGNAVNRPIPTVTLLDTMVNAGHGISDLIFSPGRPPQVERHGELEAVAVAGLPMLSAENTAAIASDLIGGNPLTLSLAAEALRRMGNADKAFDGALAQADALAAVGVEQIQGMLYDRILGHIADPEVVRVAQPGLAVRRVDVDVIRDVLSVPCELDPDRAPDIFERLRREVSMFELDDDGALRHRQDVRQSRWIAYCAGRSAEAVIPRGGHDHNIQIMCGVDGCLHGRDRRPVIDGTEVIHDADVDDICTMVHGPLDPFDQVAG